ncbi:hypothetical protein BL252_24910 [Salmonella enterica]|nr:hypothetical protein [Salmonella enterica]EBR4550611.1 hypothetical protein [Salmonella enterica]
MSEITKSLDAFLQSDNKVLVIKGDWGVGKTFFWDKYYEKHKSSLEQVAYSYISLFGKNSLSELKKEVFHSAKPVKKDKIKSTFQQQTQEASGIYSYVPWLNPKEKVIHKIPLLKYLMKYADNTPYLFRASSAISSLEYSLINNYLVCFDDLERRGNGLSIKEIMGFIDELAQRKHCKIILIFNEESLHHKDDKEIFNSYREKIVDIELKFTPTIKDNFNCIFLRNTQDYDFILNVIEKLGVKNIRFFKKLKQLLLTFQPLLQHADKEVAEEFILRASILCWGYYIPSVQLPYAELKLRLESSAWLSFLADDDHQETDADKAFHDLENKFPLPSSSFDLEIDYFLNNGYIRHHDEFHNLILQKNTDSAEKKLEQKISTIWKLYHNSFRNNDNEFVDELAEILDTELKHISIRDFDSIIRMLREFDIGCDKYIEEYFNDITQRIDFSNRNLGYSLGDIYCQDIKANFKKALSIYKKSNQSITTIAIKISESNGWNPEDIRYLNSVSTQDFVEWMRERGDGAVDNVRHGLLMFRDMQHNDPAYAEITEKVIDALKTIASESKINHLRVKNILQIDLDDQ